MGRRAIVVLALVAAGCVRSQSTQCANGFVCPDGTVCVTRLDDSNLCAAADDLAACQGKADGETCGTGRRCYAVTEGLVCNDVACGNSFVDLPSADFPVVEQCDDGNTIAGDGCSADCRSTERCGNQVIDVINGEQCDDGDLLSQDGCSSTCGRESPQWLIASGPGERMGEALAYDAQRGRVVMFGGYSAPAATTVTYFDDVWEWDSVAWRPTPYMLPHPSARRGAAVTYDVARGELVMFGGDGPSIFGDTHVWTGGGWTVREVPGPSARTDAAITYDVVGRRAILFGGVGPRSPLADTWAWDGETWTELALPGPAGSPKPSLAYDPAEDLLLLATGGQTWSLRRGSAGWQLLFSAPSTTTQLVFDPVSKAVVAITTLGGQLYRRSPGGWVLDPAATLNGSSTDLTFTPDVRRGRLIAVGKHPGFLDVYEWDGTAWTVVSGVDSGPPIRAITLDTKRRRMIALDGGGTWSFEHRWRQLGSGPATSPNALLAYDEVRDRVVLLDGAATWEFDGANWTDVSPAVGPPAALGRTMVYDRARKQVVVVGGQSQTMTWLWDGQTWQSFATPAALKDRMDHAIAYDPIRERVVVFGGTTAAGDQNDTWVLEPSGWVEQHPTGSIPAPRSLTALAWDAARGRLVLYGGDFEDDTFTYGDAWEWDGARWNTVPVVEIKSVAHRALSALDGDGIMVFRTALPMKQLVWRGAASVETCVLPFDVDGDTLIGCDDPDCWSACTPLCPPGAPGCDATLAPYCGDQVCASTEQGYACPKDCPIPMSGCGDAICAGEMTSCPGDCPPI